MKKGGKDPWLERKFSALFLLFLLAVVSAILLYVAFALLEQLDKTRVAASDSRVWSVSRVEVDHLRLVLALSALRETDSSHARDEALDEISTAFDIFYSRVDVVLKSLGSDETPADLQAASNALGEARHRLAVQFDNADKSDLKSLAAFEVEVISLKRPIRKIVLDALIHFNGEVKQSRKLENAIALRFLAASLFLAGVMGVAMVIALRLRKQLITQISLMKIASENTRMVYEASMLGVVVTDMKGDIVLFNNAAETIFRCAQENMKGANFADLMLPEELKRAHQALIWGHTSKAQDENGGPRPRRMPAIRSDGTEITIEVSLRINTGLDGDDLLITFIRDISEQAAHEQNLRLARDEAQRHVAAKTMFLATMSHEMRTPLHGLLASLDLVDINQTDDNTRSLIQTARDCGLRSLHQINEVLELTQIDETREEPQVFAPARMTSSILGELRALAKDNDNQLNMNVKGASADSAWLGMPQTFTRVVYNLVGNALKFTNSGWVSITLSFEKVSGEDYTLCVSVEDTGIGIAEADQAGVFDMFFISENKANTTTFNNLQKSSGLGLPIAQIGVKKMGGELALKSELGKGSVFSFCIPLKRASDTIAPTSQKFSEGQLSKFDFKTLLIDDNTVNLELTSQMIKKLGCTTVTATDGEHAILAAQDEAFDVIFMDLNMPGLDGWSTARRIRNGGASRHAIIVAHTADMTVDDKTSGLSENFDTVLHKPAFLPDFENLFKTLSNAFDPHDPSEQATHLARTQLAEDDLQFAELEDLLGRDRMHEMLHATLADTERAVEASKQRSPQAADIAHHAVGSTAVVGLTGISNQLRHLENLLRDDPESDVTACIEDLDVAAKRAARVIQEEIAKSETGPLGSQ
jgi:PAS domain S-box-containing protein